MKKVTKREILTYIFFGILTTVVGWGSYTVFVNAAKMTVFWSNVLSWLLAAAFAFVTNKIWVFKSKDMSPKGLAREIITFFSSRIATGVLEIALVPLLEKLRFDSPFFRVASSIGLGRKIFFTSGIYSKIFVSVLVVVLNYILSKLFVFKDKKEE